MSERVSTGPPTGSEGVRTNRARFLCIWLATFALFGGLVTGAMLSAAKGRSGIVSAVWAGPIAMMQASQPMDGFFWVGAVAAFACPGVVVWALVRPRQPVAQVPAYGATIVWFLAGAAMAGLRIT